MFEDFERDGRFFRISVDPPNTSTNPEGPRLGVFVREGDRLQEIYDPITGFPGDEDELLKKGRSLVAGFCHREVKPSLKFLCDKTGLLRDLQIHPTGTAQETWDSKLEGDCVLCGGRHRYFLR